jgi:transporter family-2 protein
MLICYILLALANGLIIGTSRAFNGRLSMSTSPMESSFWNHLVGFLFLSLIISLLKGHFLFDDVGNVPFNLFLGGVIGTLFVAINSFAFVRLGAARTIFLVTAGQLIFSVWLEYEPGHLTHLVIQTIGILIVIFGIYLDSRFSLERNN